MSGYWIASWWFSLCKKNLFCLLVVSYSHCFARVKIFTTLKKLCQELKYHTLEICKAHLRPRGGKSRAMCRLSPWPCSGLSRPCLLKLNRGFESCLNNSFLKFIVWWFWFYFVPALNFKDFALYYLGSLAQEALADVGRLLCIFFFLCFGKVILQWLWLGLWI